MRESYHAQDATPCDVDVLQKMDPDALMATRLHFSAATRLVQDPEVSALIGPTCTAPAIAIGNDVAVPAGLALVSDAATGHALSELDDNDLVFRTAVSDAVEGAALAQLATSLKLPLSTTYVTFMVAMGTSFSDQAWGRDSAVYRVSGVLAVVSGWFMTALLAFT